MVETLPCGPKARRNKTCFELDLFFLFFLDFGDGDPQDFTVSSDAHSEADIQ
jgi:hypothetical protein